MPDIPSNVVTASNILTSDGNFDDADADMEAPVTPSPQEEETTSSNKRVSFLTLGASFRISTLQLVSSITGAAAADPQDESERSEKDDEQTPPDPPLDDGNYDDNDDRPTNYAPVSTPATSLSTAMTPTTTNVTHLVVDTNDDNYPVLALGSLVSPADTVTTSNTTTAEPKNKLYKSTRLKGYMTLILASIINFIAARRSATAVNSNTVSSTLSQRQYAQAVSMTSFILCAFTFLAHLDRWSPLRHVWSKAFGDQQSWFEIGLLLFLVVWWTVATGIQTSVRGICGDGKAQYNLYFSTWCCCWTTYWTLERWLVAHGWASFKAFISSWPFRAPGWIAISFFGLWTMIWYVDLLVNHTQSESYYILKQHYDNIDASQWQWLVFVGACTIVPAVCFVLVELFRETSPRRTAAPTPEDDPASPNSQDAADAAQSPPQRPHRAAQRLAARLTPMSMRDLSGRSGGSSKQERRPTVLPRRTATPRRAHPNSPSIDGDEDDDDDNNDPLLQIAGGKGACENFIEGLCLTALVILWIPTVMVSTTPGGAASLIGNAYFFTWVTTVFVMETFIWFVHDLRKGVHSSLRVKEQEYIKQQQAVLEASRALEGKRRKLRQQQLTAEATRLGSDQYSDSNISNNNNNGSTAGGSTRFGQPSVSAMMRMKDRDAAAAGFADRRGGDDESSVESALAARQRKTAGVRTGARNSLVHVASANLSSPGYEMSERLDDLDVDDNGSLPPAVTDAMLRDLDLDLDNADADAKRRSTVLLGARSYSKAEI